MKTIIKIIVIGFSLIGAFASILFIRMVVIERKHDRAYECNCSDVKIGMNIKEAQSIMDRGLDTPDYEKDTSGQIIINDGQPGECRCTYSTNGGSYVATIYFDKDNGKVMQVDCPPKRCSN